MTFDVPHLLPLLLIAQGILGGFDTLVNHEIIEKLARRPRARREIGLHSIRETTYAALFVGLGWFAWHGLAALAIAALLVLEVAITAADELVENRTRVLPQNERVIHVFLTLNFGVIVAVLAPTLMAWGGEATALVPMEPDWMRWVLAVLGVAAFAWALRDAFAWRRLSMMRG